MIRTTMLGCLCLALFSCIAANGSETPRGVDLAALQSWDIVSAEDASPSEKFAAEELQQCLAQATGQELPIVAATNRPDRHFFVGPSAALGSSPLTFSTEAFGSEDFRLVVRDGSVAIAGGRPRGTLYGVYSFLEDCLGVRFLTADHTHVPKVGEWRVVGPLDRFYHPPLEMRWSYYGEVNRNPVFAARLRVNTVGDDPRLGGRSKQRLINHSFLRHIPSKKYGKEHPEYYCLRDGKRLSEVENDGRDNEPCLTHPDVLKIVAASVLREIEGSADAANVSVSQNDNAKNCLCTECKAIDEREGTPMGSLLSFVNAVADTVGKQHPQVKVGTLAYWYTRKPPKTITPRPNVQIQLCSIECCLIHPINDPACPKNQEFCRDMSDWGKICNQIYIWNYNTNFRNYLLPCPNLRVIEPNVRFFVANHAKGIFMQAAGNARSAELSELRSYLMSQLLWDPTRSGARVIDEFLDLHYGKAAGPIREYIHRVHDRAAASGRHQNCFGRLADYGLDATDAQAGLDDFAKALSLAENDEVRNRVEKASISAYRAAIEPIWYLQQGPVDAELAKTQRPLVRRFFELCQKHGVDRAQETREDIGGARTRLRKVFGLRDDQDF